MRKIHARQSDPADRHKPAPAGRSDEPIGDPLLAVMELLTVASALPLVLLTTAVLLVVPVERRAWGILGLAFSVMFAGTTCGVHLVELTAGRQLGSHGLVWPSAPYAVELLAWDFFLGISQIFVAAALDPMRAPPLLRRLVAITGALCLIGLVGPAVGKMRLQMIGVLGYAVFLPATAVGSSRWFRNEGHARAA